MRIEKDLYYSKNHEWIKIENEKAYVGITDYAQKAMGEIVYVELPDEGEDFLKGENFCVLESVKVAADVFMPIAGAVLKSNGLLEEEPQRLNESPYENYLIILERFNEADLEELMDAETYTKYCEEEE